MYLNQKNKIFVKTELCLLPLGLGGMITALIAGDIVAWAVRFLASVIELIDASLRLIFSLKLNIEFQMSWAKYLTYQFRQIKAFW